MKKKCIGLIAISYFSFLYYLAGCSHRILVKRVIKVKRIKRMSLCLAFGSEPDTGFDPTTGWGRYGSPLFQSTLLKRDHNLNIVNDIATSYEVSEDGKVWTVILRDDVKFSDGKPLTAD